MTQPFAVVHAPRIPDLKAGHPGPAEFKDSESRAGAFDNEDAKQTWTEAGDEDPH